MDGIKTYRNTRGGVSFTLLLILFSSFSLVAKGEEKLHPNEYNATAVPIITSTIQYPYEDDMPGIVIYTAKPGTILRGATYSADGKLIKDGDVLIKYKHNRRKNILNVRKQELINIKAVLKFAKEELLRYKKLMQGAITHGNNSNIISKSTYELSISNYLKAKADVAKAEIQFIRAEGWLKLTTEHAYFDCIVTNVYIPLGLCAFESNIMTVAQLNPMGIEIKIPREKIHDIPENIPIKIYPFNRDEPIETYGFSKIVSDNSIILRVKNDPIPPQIPLEYKDIPTISKVLPVERFSLQLKKAGLAVLKTCIHNSTNGDFVWKATLNNTLDTKANRRILLFDIEKVYVKSSDEQRYITPHQLYIRLTEAGNLTTEDYILGKNLPKDLDNHKQVIFYKKRYTFSPGDPVIVKIDF